MTKQDVIALVRDIPDFPQKGILFKDITTVLKDADALCWLKDEVVKLYQDKGITKVVGLESRGFFVGSAVAMELHAGFVPMRKPGKLPADVVEVCYEKEYGTDRIQLHRDALDANDVVLIHDDLLATGGTLAAAVELVRKLGVKKIYVNCLMELDFLHGRQKLDPSIEVECLIHC